MQEISHPDVLSHQEAPSISDLYKELAAFEPKPVGVFVPKNAVEQQNLFLSDEIRNPLHEYDKLAAIDFNRLYENIDRIGEEVIHHPDLNPKYINTYEQFFKTTHKSAFSRAYSSI